MNDVTDRINTLTVKSAQNFVDGAYLVYRQNAQMAQSWYTTVEANHKASREFVGDLIKQNQEFGTLWMQFFQDSFRVAADEGIEAARQSTNGVKKAETAAK